MGAIISNFMEIIFGKYAQFKGRADRSELWMFYLVCFIVGCVFSIMMNLVVNITSLCYIILALNLLVVLGLLMPTLAVSVRRLHDIGKGGEWILINLIPVIGFVWFLVLLAKEGEKLPNRFGNPA